MKHFDLVAHLKRQVAFSRATFGPGARTAGVTDHIRKELIEIAESNGSADEWVDVVILALDGLTRQLASCRPAHYGDATEYAAETACAMIYAKQGRNELRTWPDWRTADPNKAIEHDRSGE